MKKLILFLTLLVLGLAPGTAFASYEELRERVKTYSDYHYNKVGHMPEEHYVDLLADANKCKDDRTIYLVEDLGHCVWDHYTDPTCSNHIIQSMEIILKEDQEVSFLHARILYPLIKKGIKFSKNCEDNRSLARLLRMKRQVQDSDNGKAYIEDKARKKKEALAANEDAPAKTPATDATDPESLRHHDSSSSDDAEEEGLDEDSRAARTLRSTTKSTRFECEETKTKAQTSFSWGKALCVTGIIAAIVGIGYYVVRHTKFLAIAQARLTKNFPGFRAPSWMSSSKVPAKAA